VCGTGGAYTHKSVIRETTLAYEYQAIDMARACAAIILNGTKILITQRKSNQTFPLRWELPGGHIEPHESNESCLRREIKEELGVQITVPGLYSTEKSRIGKNTLLIYYYLCRIASGKLRKLEVKDFRWIDPPQYEAYDLLLPDKKVLEKLARSWPAN
jgi:8-oxo-dGTP diphosphatase